MKEKVYFLDFEDSYSYNIIADIYKYSSLLPEVVALKDHKFFLQHLSLVKKSILILGPGPNRPKDYLFQFNAVKKILASPHNIKILGICLGHQLLMQIMGYRLKKSRNPLHGSSVQLPLNEYWKFFFATALETLDVQRYNSLAVVAQNGSKLTSHYLCLDKEIMVYFHDAILSMQFHPESIGTTHKEIIFRRINSFIKS